jgi:hypothetical protein
VVIRIDDDVDILIFGAKGAGETDCLVGVVFDLG